jgi:hypothetical protein
LFFRLSRNSAAHRQWCQASIGDIVVEPVTPAGGGIGVVTTFGIVCEAVAGLMVFFSDSVAKGFLWIGTSSEYILNSQTIKYTWAQASFSSTVPEIFWLAGCQPQPMFRSQRPEECVEKLQLGTKKQILSQLGPVDFRVHDMEEVQLSPDRRRRAACA